MITVRPLASSSAGNAYAITDGRTPLLLEAGLNYRSMQIALNFKMSQIDACLITHEHLDHCKSVRELLKNGFDVYASAGTWAALDIVHHRAHVVEAHTPFTIGTWSILPFDVQHDVSEPMGYLLANQSGDKLVFLTDTYYCRYRFEGLTHIMLETNYSLKILDDNIAAGRVPAVMRKRLIRSHFSIEHAKEFLLANDLTKVVEIWLLHLSDTNSDEASFKREIQQLTGKQVYVAGR